MGVKANKRNGHKAEAEAAEITQGWPKFLRTVRTGLDGGTDLRGSSAHGEVKAVRSGPVWLKSMLSQLDNEYSPYKFGMVKLSNRTPGRTGWLVVLDREEFEKILGGLND